MNLIGVKVKSGFWIPSLMLLKKDITIMIDENKLLAWLQDEYGKFSRDELREYNEYIYRHLRGKMDFIQDLLIEIKQGRFNENQTKDV